MTKLGFFYVLKVGIALGAGLKIGKELPDAFAYALNKRNREHYRRAYQDAMAKETSKQSHRVRVVPDQTSETPTTGA